MEKQENIIATYQQIIQETEQQLQKAQKRIRYISLLRLILFVEAVASAIIFWSDGWLKLIVFYRNSHHRFHLAGAKPQPMVLLERLSQKENRNQSAGTTSTAI